MIIFFILFFYLDTTSLKHLLNAGRLRVPQSLVLSPTLYCPRRANSTAVSFGPAALTAVFPLYSVSFCFMLFLYSPGVIPQCFLNTLPKPFAVA